LYYLIHISAESQKSQTVTFHFFEEHNMPEKRIEFKARIKKDSVAQKKWNLASGEYIGYIDFSKKIFKLIPHSEMPKDTPPLSFKCGDLTEVFAILAQLDDVSDMSGDLVEGYMDTKRQSLRREDTLENEAGHHIIPHTLCKNHHFMHHAIRLLGYQTQGDENTFYLPKQIHEKRHKEYTDYVEKILDKAYLRAERELKKGESYFEESIKTQMSEIRETLIKLLEGLKKNMTS
jgi:hypothetical protein